jgi:ubiquinone/menaquinone biosynthesis C-methylase UbiE
MRLLGILLSFAALASSQVATEANRHYADPESRERMLGILAHPDRPERLQAGKLVSALDLSPGDAVVDLGTGAGVLLPYLSRAVGPTGKVVAQDIHEDFLDAARKTAAEAGLANVTFRVGGEREPKLPDASADLILAVDTYHHIDYPEPMLAGIREALKPGGRLAIMDYYKYGFRDPDHIRADKPEVIREIESAGFRLTQDLEHVPDTQYLLIFEKSPI